MDSLDKIEQEIRLCQRCELRSGCSNPVPGFGSVGAKYFIIGESPGFNEDQDGIPFCGASGRRLDTLLKLADIDINDCFLSNSVRCRPPKNRDPRKKELQACLGFLHRELVAVKPQVVITLGSTPLKLFVDYGVRQVHGTQFRGTLEGKEYQVIAQYHPAAALHAPRLWADMLSDWEHLPVTVPHDFTITTWKDLEAYLHGK